MIKRCYFILFFKQSGSRQRKGQAALEYLTTYGWAFIVILASVGVLAYFGFLNPSKYIPESCDFGEQLRCEDHYLDDDGLMKLRLKNNFQEDIEVSNVTLLSSELEDNDIDGFSGEVIPEGDITKVDFTIEDASFNTKRKQNIPVLLTFRREGSPIYHNITGTVFTKVSESDLLN
ncbi:MAG: hypothetical protein ACQESC_02525 [Nanobdellota archaeon]